MKRRCGKGDQAIEALPSRDRTKNRQTALLGTAARASPRRSHDSHLIDVVRAPRSGYIQE